VSEQHAIKMLSRVIAILVVFLLAGGVALSVMIGNQNEIEQNQDRGRAQRQEHSAEVLYLECNPETPVVVSDPERRRICEGYSTMAEALETERTR
jgi:flagellar basal body-associated protein FliL